METKPQYIRGAIEEVAEDDTFEVVIATEIKVLRRDYNFDSKDSRGYYYEQLVCTPESVRQERIIQGLPLFDNHPYDYRATLQLGKTQSIAFENGTITAKVKWGARADEAIKSDVKNKIVTGISAGYNRYKYEQVQEQGDDFPTRRYVDWEILEISLAPVNADPDSHTREAECVNIEQEQSQLNIISQITSKF